jgi:hypothetical protein
MAWLMPRCLGSVMTRLYRLIWVAAGVAGADEVAGM